MSNVTEQQVREMARLTMLSNRLNEIQEKNLRMYPYVFFDHVKTVTITFDLECRPDSVDKRETFVKYQIQVDPTKPMDNKENRIKALVQATRNLFWTDLKVEIEFPGVSK